MGSLGVYRLPAVWEHCISAWLRYLRAAGQSKATLHNRRGIIRMVAHRSDTATPDDVSGAWLVDLCGTENWSTDYRRSLRTVLVKFYTWAIDTGRATHNPGLALPKAPESRPKPRPVTDSVWAQLLERAAPRERLMARLAAEAGLRRGEVARVHRRDLMEDMSGWSLIVHGKGAKQRVVPLTASLADALQSYSSGYSPAGYVFPGQDEGHLSAHTVGKLVGDLMPPGWTMHKLRHRFASRGYAGTRNLAAVQSALGHASLATTQRYVATTNTEVRAVAESAA